MGVCGFAEPAGVLRQRWTDVWQPNVGGASAGAAEVVVAERRCTVIVRCGRDGQGKPAGKPAELLEATVVEVDVRAS